MLHELRGHRVHEKLLPKRAGPLSLHVSEPGQSEKILRREAPILMER